MRGELAQKWFYFKAGCDYVQVDLHLQYRYLDCISCSGVSIYRSYCIRFIVFPNTMWSWTPRCDPLCRYKAGSLHLSFLVLTGQCPRLRSALATTWWKHSQSMEWKGSSAARYAAKKPARVCFLPFTSKEHESILKSWSDRRTTRRILMNSAWLMPCAVYIGWLRVSLCRMEIDSLLHKPVPCLHMQSVDIRCFGMEVLTSNGLIACRLWRYCQMKVLGN